MTTRAIQLVLQYDGSGFSGWQRQPETRTVQGVVEVALERLCAAPIAVLGAGRTDAGVHATGQAAGVRVPARWSPHELRRALNALLPDDVWVAAAHAMQPEFHARFDAVGRAYRYRIGLDEEAASPFRRRHEWSYRRPLDQARLESATARIRGEHVFRAFAVQGTAPPHDTHRCRIANATWIPRDGGLDFVIEANRFLHHMVRFLVGTLLDVAADRRPTEDMDRLLAAGDNRDVSPPAPPHALFLERVRYPPHRYLDVR